MIVFQGLCYTRRNGYVREAPPGYPISDSDTYGIHPAHAERDLWPQKMSFHSRYSGSTELVRRFVPRSVGFVRC